MQVIDPVGTLGNSKAGHHFVANTFQRSKHAQKARAPSAHARPREASWSAPVLWRFRTAAPEAKFFKKVIF
jgi:hypothetical protein